MDLLTRDADVASATVYLDAVRAQVSEVTKQGEAVMAAMTYWLFVRSFENVVERNTEDSGAQLTRLL